VLDLFSGIGGFSLGLERTGGFETAAFCEYAEFPRKVLAKHWPEVPIYNDVRELTAERLDADGIGSIDLICGGYPCQPFSHAGKRLGAEDDRHLWPEMSRLIASLRPTWVIGENVAGHVSMGLDDVLADLGTLGYACQAFVIPACAIGAIHKRERVWIVAYSNLFGSVGLQCELGQSRQIRQGWANNEAACSTISSDAIGIRQQRSRRPKKPSDPAAHRDWEANQFFDALGWPTESPVRGRNDGFSRRMDIDRLHALGNAVVPQIPEMIGNAILESMKEAA
jgi:DNA (cytosine-5)-methyltransferase 1